MTVSQIQRADTFPPNITPPNDTNKSLRLSKSFDDANECLTTTGRFNGIRLLPTADTFKRYGMVLDGENDPNSEGGV